MLAQAYQVYSLDTGDMGVPDIMLARARVASKTNEAEEHTARAVCKDGVLGVFLGKADELMKISSQTPALSDIAAQDKRMIVAASQATKEPGVGPAADQLD